MNRFIDVEIVGLERTRAHSLCGRDKQVAVSELCCASAIVTPYHRYLEARITSAQMGFLSYCSHVKMMKLRRRFSSTDFTAG